MCHKSVLGQPPNGKGFLFILTCNILNFRKIFDKIDKDGDKKVSEDELRMWIKYVQNKYILEDSERQWKEHEVADNLLPWESYKQRTYGTQDGQYSSVFYTIQVNSSTFRFRKTS